MLRNKFYLYGDESVVLPASLHVGKLMLNRFKAFDDYVAIIDAATDERMTFKEVLQLAVDVALSLTHIGIKKGDVVSICSQNVMEFLPVVYGTLAAGAAFSPIDVTLEKASLLHRLNLVKPKILFLSPPAYNKHKDTIKPLAYIDKIIIFGESFENTLSFKDFLTEHASVDDFEAAPVNGTDDIALILFSSGTTGVSKGIKISHLNLLLHIIQDKNDASRLGVTSLGLFECYNSFGLVVTLYSHQKGFTMVLHNNADTRKSFEIIEKYKINNIPSNPTTLVQLMKLKNSSHYDTSSIKAIVVTATICHESTLEAIRKRFPSAELVMQFYGMTECGPICIPTRGRFGPRAGSVGGVQNNFVLKVVDVETRQPLGPNQRGEICCKSPAVMKGYIGETIEYLDEEGFFKTGDIGYYDEDQYVYVVDRIKDLIKFNNYHVPPAEIESIILQHPAVQEVGVVGAKNEEYSELPTAFVALQSGAQVTEQELVDFVGKQVSYKMRLAGGVRFLDALPRCAGVKVDRKKLRTML